MNWHDWQEVPDSSLNEQWLFFPNTDKNDQLFLIYSLFLSFFFILESERVPYQQLSGLQTSSQTWYPTRCHTERYKEDGFNAVCSSVAFDYVCKISTYINQIPTWPQTASWLNEHLAGFVTHMKKPVKNKTERKHDCTCSTVTFRAATTGQV